MAHYMFYKRRTQKQINGEWYSHDGFELEDLHKVDEFICDWFGDEVDPKKYHPVYHWVVDAAFCALLSLGGGGIERQHIMLLQTRIDGMGGKTTGAKANLKGLVEQLFGQRYFFVAGR